MRGSASALLRGEQRNKHLIVVALQGFEDDIDDKELIKLYYICNT